MKRKSLLFALLLTLFMPWAANAQETVTTVTIGNVESTSTSYHVPYNSLYGYSFVEQLYSADEIAEAGGMAGTISTIRFYHKPSTTPSVDLTNHIVVYMMNVDKTSFSAATDYVPVTTSDIVFDGDWTIPTTTGWIDIVLDAAFAYDGTSDLMVAVHETTSGYSSRYFQTTTTTNAVCTFYHDSNNPDPYNLDSYSGNKAVNANRANIQLDITPSGGVVCNKPETLEATNVTAYDATLTWTGGSGEYNIQYKSPDDDWTDLAYEVSYTSYSFSGHNKPLDPNTTYSFRVQSYCGTDPETEGEILSGWRTIDFTTDNPCAAPTNLQISDVTAESATLTWTPGYQETTWTVKYKKSTETEYTTETVNDTPTLTLSNLASLTTYNVQIYNCENYVSGNFTTAAGIPLVEEFGTSAPTGWSQKSGLLADVLNGTALSSGTAWYFGTSNGVFDNHARTNIYGTSRKHWLVMPAVPMENNVQLSFEVAYTAYNGTAQAPAQTGTDDKFVVLVSTDDMATWTILRQWDNASSEYVLNDLNPTPIAVNFDLSSYVGQNVIVAFYVESTESNADNNLHIDNVSIDYIPDCAKPAGLGTSDVTAHEATISWTSDAEAWQVMLNDDEDNIIDVEENTYTFTLLDPETTYTAKVRTNCNGVYSEWTNPVSFTTTIACPAPTTLAVTPYGLTATFTWQSDANAWEVAYATDVDADPAEYIVGTVNEATYTANDLELGDYYFWVRANCGDLDGYSEWAGPVSVHIGYCLPAPTSVDNSGISNVTFGTGDYIVNNDTPKATYTDYTEQIGAVQAGTEASIAITFKTGYTYDTYVWVDLDNSLSFETNEVVCYGVSTNANPTTLTLNFIIPVTQTLGDFRLRIGSADSGLGSDPNYANPCYTGSYGCFQDYTLRVLEAPSCLTPTDLAVNYTGGTTAEVSWTSDATSFNIDVNGEVTEGVTNPYTLEGLELATTYEVKVQADCGDNVVSEWTNAVSFATDLCMPENQCEITFALTDSYGDGWNGAYIEVLDVETGTSLAQMSNNNIAKVTETETYTLAVCDGRQIQFVWHSGSYDSECSYIVTDVNGEEIFSGSSTMSEPVNYTVNCPQLQTFTKEIVGFGDPEENRGGYYLIASPVAGDPITSDMITDDLGNTATPETSTYDLYYFNQEEDDEWRNYRDETFEIVPGKGYLYASREGTTITFTGLPGTNGQVTLSKTDNTNADFQGWNLIGNPFAETAYITGDYEFYTLNSNGTELEASTSNSIEAMEGVFVIATNDGETLTFTTEEPNNDKSMLALNLSKNDRVIDRAIVRFCESRQLPKFQLRKNSTKIYIPMEDNDYAVVRSEGMGEMPVSFKAEENGNYTISFNTENVEFGYLHLIDNMTGADVDLLSTPSYSFEARTTDYASRFKLVFATGNADDSFAFFSNGNFVINNEGMATVQVIDINGRIMSSETINGCANVNVNAAAGVYMIRLINGESVKVQKVVVR